MPNIATPEEPFIWVEHEDPAILPAYVARSALEAEEGMAERGWREMKTPPDLDEDGRPIAKTTNKPSKKADHAAAVTEEN